MGRKSREKAQRRADGITRKDLKKLLKGNKPTIYQNAQNGAPILLNPLKRLVKGKTYKDAAGLLALTTTIRQYAAYMQAMKPAETEGDKQ